MQESLPEINLPLAWLLIFILLIISALFSAAESALFSLGAVKLARMKEQGAKAVDTVHKLLSAPRRLTAALTIGNDAALAAAAVLVTLAAASSRGFGLPGLSGHGALVWAFVVSFALMLFVAQAAPRAAGVLFSEWISKAAARPVWVFMRASFPLRWLFRVTAELLLKAVGAFPERFESERLAEEDIKELVEEGSREGVLDVTERELLVNLLRGSSVTASDIMTPRHRVKGISVDAGHEDLRSLVEEHDFSRFPVYREGREEIAGVVTAKDLLRLRLASLRGEELSISEVMRSPLFVPESRRLRDLLLDFRRSRLHMALVVDEFGSVSGLVTMEDVLEEIFGEVREDAEPELVNLGEDHWKVLGRMEIADFNTRTGASIPLAGARTLSGLVLGKLGRRPRPGDHVRASGFEFKIMESRGIIIDQLEVKRMDET